MNSIKKAYLFAGMAVLFWSTVATAFKIALREFDFIHFILKETIFITTFIGLVFIIAGIFIQQLEKR